MILNEYYSAAELLKRYQQILLRANIGLWAWSLDTDEIQCDEGICALYDLPAGQYVGSGEGWYARIHPEDRKKTKALMQSVFNDEIELDSMFRIVTDSGHLKYIRTAANKVRDDQGNLKFLIGLNWEVTNEISLKQDFVQAQQFLEKIMDAIPDPVFVKNKHHQWIFANAEFEKMIGHPRKTFIGQSDHAFFPKEFADNFWKNDDLVFKARMALEKEEQVVNGNGEVRDILTKKTPYRLNENEEILVGVIRDITETKKIQKSLVEQSKMATLGEMASGIAHEINNPLTIISGKAQLLKHKVDVGVIDTEKFSNDLSSILKNCARIEKIIRSLTSFSRNTVNDPFEKISVLKLIEDAFEICQEKFDKSNIKLSLVMGVGIGPETLIEAKNAEMIQVLINLLNNSYDAVKNFTDPWVKIVLSDHFDFVNLQIIDSGAGIPPEIAKKIMEPFFTTKPTGLGTGLGLSLALQIVKSHGGTLEYAIDQEGHTSFTLRLRKNLASN